MRKLIARLFRAWGLLRFDLLTQTTSAFPAGEAIPAGELLIVRDGAIDKWACLSCPGGCGKTISLSLNPTRRPCWSVIADFWRRPTVHPSVHQQNECACHFWIQNGAINWCVGGRPHQDTACNRAAL